MDNLKYWLAISKASYSDSKFIKALIEYFDSPKMAWTASGTDLMQMFNVNSKKIESFIALKNTINPDELLDYVEKKNIKVITFNNKEYPFLLKQIYDFPAILYVKGDLNSCNMDKTLAVVGSRTSSNYSKDILNKLIDDIRGEDITIISGLAIGVDSCAHSAAIRNNLKTIGVIASGFDYIYPKENKKLYKQIEESHGAVISEYYPSERPEIWKFPKRNRIISGLAKGTLIVEAGLKSGALITAKLCLEQNRELMCIPGLITNPNTEGIYKLLKEGAGLVTKAKDIFDSLNWQYNLHLANLAKNSPINLLDNEKQIYEILNLEPKTFDEILGESKINAQKLMGIITTMELTGIIKQLPGQKYTKVL